ncbi:sulfurtransferase [Asticcacaulis machinosus]|uniref:Sulfurtransferase n=1 Tax=Asticcacaulis machinosus TaxID=2984211 RepID=A0ABT5HF09_9CAUL|nr:sulfurtransferase [Asticcacaulis machinosus]MDC7674840.1 sulfurtransferase [Asticcacaulis machinosus]
MTSSQIDVEELNGLLGKGSVKILDGSWDLGGADMKTAFRKAHIPTAQFFDLDAVSDHSIDLPHMAPSPAQFAEAVGKLGISESDHVVIYDQQGLFSAARIWWTFKLMGHHKVQILKGGLPAWRGLSAPLTDEISAPTFKSYKANYNADLIVKIYDLSAQIGINGFMIFDARSRARFHGAAPEPRPGLISGHIPQSHSLPFDQLLENGQLRPVSDLKSIFDHMGLTPDQTAVTTCGSGVTAAIIALALHEIGHKHIKLYDGSWAEWGQPHLNMPVNI